MESEDSPELQLEGWLKTIGVEGLCQWDVLVFLYRHQTSLVSAEHIARLLGYPTGAVVDALDSLESLGLVARSRVDQGVRFYQSRLPGDSPGGDTLHRLMTFADGRAGRLLLAQKLRRRDRPDQNNGPSRLPREGGSATWLKVI